MEAVFIKDIDKQLINTLLKDQHIGNYLRKKLYTPTLPQQEIWQNIDGTALTTIYEKDGKEVEAKLNFSVRGGYPRVTVFTDITNVNRDTIITATFNYKRIYTLIMLMEITLGSIENGRVFSYTTRNVEYTKDNRATNNIIDETEIHFRVVDGVYQIAVESKIYRDLPIIYFPITNENEEFGEASNHIGQPYPLRDDSQLAIKVLIDRLKYIYKSMELQYIRETQARPLNKTVKAEFGNKGKVGEERLDSDYFKSLAHEYLFYLTKTDGSVRQELLGIKKIHYYDKNVAKMWYNGIRRVIEVAKGIDIYNQAVANLDKLYKNMVE